MDLVPNEKFYELFTEMIDCMTDMDNFERERLVKVLIKLSELFRISKGVTEFYVNETKEKLGEGEKLVDFDNGKGGPAIIERRYITKAQAVIKGTIYRPEDEEPLSEYDLQRLDIVVRSLLSFVGRNRLASAIETLGFYDDSGFKNRRAFLRQVDLLYGQGRLCGNYTAMMINLRHFTIINQDIGRKNGDIVLKNFYKLIAAIADSDGIVSRMGGDNFLALMRSELLEHVLTILRGVPIYYDKENEKRIMVYARAGIFKVPEDFSFEASSEIMDKVLRAYQAAKQSDSETISYYSESMGVKRDSEMRIQQLFEPALAKKEFKVYYQPKVDVDTGEIIGAEALCRWFHDEKLISPAEFIPVLEQSNDICRLDFYILDVVCSDIRRWLDACIEPVRTSVNLSRKNLVDIDLLRHIIDIIDRHRVPHQYIEIELTETTTDVEFRVLKRIVSGLQDEGIYTSVDDFGVGYSSLNLIREIPWNVLKIDRCFLPEDDEDESSVTSLMYRHVVAMALDIGLECITEGVETTKQIEILRANHCKHAQGFIFDKPLPRDRFEKVLSRHRYDLTEILK
ncbi:MAG: bifunctional diguanylate cyclase/phosphodiesterase [Ruminococcus sp.]|nr:bifunctional diguanylate cyclase/phosphodiesterase [Ruminococcus sp.]